MNFSARWRERWHRWDSRGERATSMIDDRSITGTCIDYANAIGRRPSMAELCIAASVSERRVRTAFMRLYDTPPSVFFRAWALTEARRQADMPKATKVRSAGVDDETATNIKDAAKQAS
jgi:AraC-like DNA-binding protein